MFVSVGISYLGFDNKLHVIYYWGTEWLVLPTGA